MLTRVRFGSAGAFGPMQPLAMTGQLMRRRVVGPRFGWKSRV